MLPARAGEIARARHGDRARARELGHDRVGEARHRVGEEHRVGADAYEVASFGERRDDLFVDRKRHRIYVICGAGAIDVIEPQGDGYRRIVQLPTAPSARTALFVPELDRLYVAVANTGPAPAAIWVFRPAP